MVERTAENCEAVKRFLVDGLGGEIRAMDAGDLSGVYFHSDQRRFGRLHVGERLLADAEPEDLIRRLTEHRVLDHLRSGQSVQVLTTGTAFDQ